MSPSPPPSWTIASASFLVTAVPSRVPFGPTRENRNGGAAASTTTPAAAAGPAALTARVSGSLTGSGSPPVRPPTWVVSSPSPSMKKLSEPCLIRSTTVQPLPPPALPAPETQPPRAGATPSLLTRPVAPRCRESPPSRVEPGGRKPFAAASTYDQAPRVGPLWQRGFASTVISGFPPAAGP